MLSNALQSDPGLRGHSKKGLSSQSQLGPRSQRPLRLITSRLHQLQAKGESGHPGLFSEPKHKTNRFPIRAEQLKRTSPHLRTVNSNCLFDN
jgi:hypothetical protein